jgi:hypothetical protein
MESKEIIQVAVNIVIGPILSLLQEDPHQWSERGCNTCKTISGMIGRPFGCYEYQRRKSGRKEDK